MSKRALPFLMLAVVGCGGGPPTHIELSSDQKTKKKPSSRGPAAKKAKEEAERRQTKLYLTPVAVPGELDILKELRYQECPQDHGAPYRVGWTRPGETYPLDSVDGVLENMRPVYEAMAAIIERRGPIEPVDYDELRHHAGRLRMHAGEIYRLHAGPGPEKVFATEKFSEAAPSNEWCLKAMAAKIERATLIEATQELRRLWEDFKRVCAASKLDLAGSEEEAAR